MRILYKILIALGLAGLLLVVVGGFLIAGDKPERIQYGMSFNTFYTRDLGLEPKVVYDAILDDLGVRHLRLAAHWPMVEPIDGVYDFSDLDYQLDRAEEVGADVILAVGRRLPRWPECHIPDWADDKTWEQQQAELLDYMKVVANRYKDRSVIKYWQIENEPYLEVFAKDHCGPFDQEFFEYEIEYFRTLDNTRPLLVTDSGNLGTWWKPYKQADAFGTSVYVYFWNPELGQFRTILPPIWYRLRTGILTALNPKEVMLIELSIEPWLIEPVTDVDIETQYTRMNPEKFASILEYAEKTHLEKQYLWGAEWWYWLKEQGDPEMWEMGKGLFSNN